MQDALQTLEVYLNLPAQAAQLHDLRGGHFIGGQVCHDHHEMSGLQAARIRPTLLTPGLVGQAQLFGFGGELGLAERHQAYRPCATTRSKLDAPVSDFADPQPFQTGRKSHKSPFKGLQRETADTDAHHHVPPTSKHSGDAFPVAVPAVSQDDLARRDLRAPEALAPFGAGG